MKSPRLRLHLSTCILLMFVAGGLVWANLQKRHHPFIGRPDLIGNDCWGWPAPVRDEVYEGNFKAGSWTVAEAFRWSKLNCVFDVAVGLTLLVAVAFSSEWFIRRREVRKP